VFALACAGVLELNFFIASHGIKCSWDSKKQKILASGAQSKYAFNMTISSSTTYIATQYEMG
jgi:hypothetical protein